MEENVILYGEIKIDPATLKMRDPYSVFQHESGQYPADESAGGSGVSCLRPIVTRRRRRPTTAKPVWSDPLQRTSLLPRPGHNLAPS